MGVYISVMENGAIYDMNHHAVLLRSQVPVIPRFAWMANLRLYIVTKIP